MKSASLEKKEKKLKIDFTFIFFKMLLKKYLHVIIMMIKIMIHNDVNTKKIIQTGTP